MPIGLFKNRSPILSIFKFLSLSNKANLGCVKEIQWSFRPIQHIDQNALSMQKSISFYTIILACFLTFAIFSSYSNEGSNSSTSSKAKSEEQGMDLPQVIRAINLEGRSFDFAGEAFPMDNFDVRERLDRELLRNSYYHSNTIGNIKRARRYFPVIEPILAKHGLPDDLKYLAVAESDLSNATSPAGAKGVWQFMKGTAGDYGMQVNSEVDERFHLEKATDAACRYLKKYKERFGSWTLAAAAYNMGASRLSREMAAQRMESYFDLNLNSETSRYVFRIVAIKAIMSSPEDFGFYVGEELKYEALPPAHLIEVKESVSNWGDFAQKYGTTYRMLKIYNPWLRSTSLTNKAKKTYWVKVPKK